MTSEYTAVTQDNTNDLEDKVRQLIYDEYGTVFKGRLEVEPTESGYLLTLGVPSNSRPSFIDIQGTEKQFFDILKKELKENKRLWIDYRQVNLIHDD